MSALVVVKVGGSLFDLPDLGPRLRRWLDADARVRPPSAVLLVPGGGPTADVVRDLDRRHGLGDEAAHWLALRAMTLNAHFLAELLPPTVVVGEMVEPGPRVRILDALAFVRDDERRQGRIVLPHTWDAGSDAVAARVAVATGARRLVLLKSTTIAIPEVDWEDVSRRGLVDPLFASVLRAAPCELEVSAVNLRTWT
jgi:aspartokinase-like uncharacterized kinase